MILDLIYPPTCGFCGKINKKHLCTKCANKIKKYEIGRIDRIHNKYFNYQIKILKYENEIRDKIIDYKFNESSYLYKTFGKIILNNEKIYGFLKNYDIILCVPIHIRRKMQRGYNQSELIANEIAKNTGITYMAKNLVKIKNTEKQSTLTKSQRVENVENAFAVKEANKIVNKKIILFDDIYTTGSTVNECSRVLKKAGAKEIAVLTVAVD